MNARSSRFRHNQITRHESNTENRWRDRMQPRRRSPSSQQILRSLKFKVNSMLKQPKNYERTLQSSELHLHRLSLRRSSRHQRACHQRRSDLPQFLLHKPDFEETFSRICEGQQGETPCKREETPRERKLLRATSSKMRRGETLALIWNPHHHHPHHHQRELSLSNHPRWRNTTFLRTQ